MMDNCPDLGRAMAESAQNDRLRKLEERIKSFENVFRASVMPSAFGDTEIILQDCVMVWERWDARTEIARTPDGLLVGVRLNGFSAQ